MVVFLHGNDSCSGMVGIEQGTETYWLSGSNDTWNRDTANEVCQHMNCGTVSNFTFNRNTGMNVWDKSFHCLSKSECKQKTPSPGYNNTIATVKCSGNVRPFLHSIYEDMMRFMLLYPTVPFVFNNRRNHRKFDQQMLGGCQCLSQRRVWRCVCRRVDRQAVSEAVWKPTMRK